MGDGVDAHQHVGLLLGDPGVFGAHLAGHFAEVVEHLRKREHQRRRKAVLIAVVGIAVVHAGVNLRIVFGLRHIDLAGLLQHFANRLCDVRMPLDGALYCLVKG